MSDLNNSTDMNTAISGTVTGEITIASVIVVFMLFSVSLVLYLRAKGYAGAIGSLSLRSHGNEVVSAQNQPTVMRQYRLDPLILKSLPLTIFEAEDFCDEGGLECSVCLSELTDRDETCFLPKCRHGFHVWCIDTWFQSNSTCPICRNPVGSNTRVEKSSVGVQIEPLGVVSESGHLVGLQNSLSNRLSEGSSSSRGSFSEKRGKRMLAIEVPKRMVYEGNLNSLALERFRSLRLSLSRGGGLNSKGIGSSCSSRSGDIEQGVVVGSENTETLRVFQVSGVCYTIE